MRILIISNLFPPEVLGGYEILCEQVVRGLLRLGHDVRVLTTGEAADAFPGQVDRTLSLVQSFDSPARRWRLRRWRVDRENYRATQQMLASFEPDLVFFWSQLRLGCGAMRAVEASRLPRMFTWNDAHLAGYLAAPWRLDARGLAAFGLDRLMSSITLSGIDLSGGIVISQKLKEDLLDLGLPVDDARVVYQGIPIETFPFRGPEVPLGDPPRLLYTGQLHPYKGVGTLLEAVRNLEREGRQVEVTIVGAGAAEYEAELSGVARRLASKVRFLGRLPHSSLPSIYRAHDIFVFPSIWSEPFGLTHLEAMASGLPVVSTANGGHGEFLRDGRNALVFEPGDAAALGSQVGRLLDKPRLRRKLVEEARRHVERDFSLERYVEDLETHLLEQVGRAA